ncbi:Valine--tRNA ligase [Jeotgalicoccus aerolatus]|uniref:Valine--tRNA ligase n=1 Tax=Jeotgalicoccus aerolatus TaxID=709510 RepID=A0ABS4HMR7_9STAP|nr:valine--tRNA ligase [Jeotgalicoccus aerolatus]MBP1951929.1 valyl-tRNA synthetase [Jeotgalicoccus aerolatus]GGD93652.1 valine--tRNA ligase [Jeotgalicoccus aerolatus]CAD2074859.1 Valine--tRNA ligase [Jeotgalicoccus aerolatus]
MEMPKKYNPAEVEQGKYEKWVKAGVFKSDVESDKTPFSIVIPPPNVTGKLHLGHAWDTTLQDIITRMKRMQGYDVLYLPGMDHAGIATQAKVDARLREAGINRHDIGRDKFLEHAWNWKEEYAGHIRAQWEKLGLGLDYDKERFTLDAGLSKAVRKTFVDLYNKGLIYRGEYIINWDPETQTALSDIEVIHKDIEGKFYHVKYPLTDGSGFLEIATTRPETMLGDTAVVVHPDDERYKDLIGKTVTLPIVGRELPIIADSYVEQEFGSGAMKVTPAHDPNDFEIGNRHDLERINVMHPNGVINDLGGAYAGMDRFDARKQLVKDLEDQGYMLKIEAHMHSVGHSERSNAIVEPYLSTQWFVSMKPLAEKSLKNQETDKRIDFVPNRFEHTFNGWMENIRDWVISRQLWWGHQIPAWYHNETGELYVGEEAPADSENWTQDEDVLDTWFSSALWPFSTMGWPEETPDLAKYFPTNVLVTGYDIIFFWVARMIFSSLEQTGEKPFDDVLLHGLVRDEQNRKMSKSLGNGVDPMDVIDKYGADALRYFLSTGSTPGQDLRYSDEKVESVWNFINKIWNASRFALMNIGEDFTLADINLAGEKSLADKWILTRLNETIADVTRLSDDYEFGEVGRVLYNFIWDDFCDWYIEMAKVPMNDGTEAEKQMTRSVLLYTLDKILKMLHPYMPFVTDEIYQTINTETSIVVSSWPTVDDSLTFEDASAEMELLVNIIKSVRTTRNEVNTPLSKPIDIKLEVKDDNRRAAVERNKHYIERFTNPEHLTIAASIDKHDDDKTDVVKGATVVLPLAGLINKEEEIARLEKELDRLNGELKRVSGKLNNEKFVSNAPEKIVDEERQKQAGYQAQYEEVEARLNSLRGVE